MMSIMSVPAGVNHDELDGVNHVGVNAAIPVTL